MTQGFFAGRTTAGLAADLRAGRRTAAELADRALAAIAELDPELNAFVTVDAEGARAAARRADGELAAGVDRGPLHGLPVGVKDLVDVAGLPATMGSKHFAGHVPDTDAAVVTRLRAAGAIIVGKTTTHEFAYGPTGDRAAGGPSRNPHDPRRMSGGSSGGSAVAVAAGMVPFAIGTDTGGSVRMPAALCGVAGFKPAYGVIPTDGVFPLATSFDHVGVLAGGAADCRVAYEALVGAVGPGADAGSVRLAWLDPDAFVAGDPRVTAAVRARIEAAAGPVGDLAAPEGFAAATLAVYRAIQSSEAAAVHADRLAEAPELFDPEVLERLREAAAVPGWRYVRAVAARAGLRRDAAALFERHDVLALPTIALVAPFIDQRLISRDDGDLEVRGALLALTSPWNVVGFPALTVPAGTVDGLPIGLQLVAPAGREGLLFAVAERLVA